MTKFYTEMLIEFQEIIKIIIQEHRKKWNWSKIYLLQFSTHLRKS